MFGIRLTKKRVVVIGALTGLLLAAGLSFLFPPLSIPMLLLPIAGVVIGGVLGDVLYRHSNLHCTNNTNESPGVLSENRNGRVYDLSTVQIFTGIKKTVSSAMIGRQEKNQRVKRVRELFLRQDCSLANNMHPSIASDGIWRYSNTRHSHHRFAIAR